MQIYQSYEICMSTIIMNWDNYQKPIPKNNTKNLNFQQLVFEQLVILWMLFPEFSDVENHMSIVKQFERSIFLS